MKTLIVSDIHLTHVFDEKKFLFLKELFSSFEKIILNGDFWDGHSTTFERFIASPWNTLFPLLKSKGAIYLYGNHDLKEFSDERVSLFSVESGYTHMLKIESAIYHVEHGNMLYPSIDEVFHFSRKILQYMNTIAHRVEHGLISLGSPHNFILKRANSIIKRRLKVKKLSLWYLCGHTHFAEFDIKSKFANSGFIQYGKATYLIADSSGLSLKTESYR